MKNIGDPLFTVIDKIEADPLAFIEDVLPAILYFDKVQGIQVAIEHLLTAVNVVLDTIRPIYDIDIYALVAEKAGVDLHFATTDPVNFLLVKLNEYLEANTNLKISIDFTVESLSATLNFTDPIKFTSANGDDAYTVALSENGKMDLVTRAMDFGIEELLFADNAGNLIRILKNYIHDENALSLIMTILQALISLDVHVNEYYGINDVALSTVFWIIYGADSVTDATADYFYRYTGEGGAAELITTMLDSSSAYLVRAGFVVSEFMSVEFPHLMEAITNSGNLLKPYDDYTDEERSYVLGIMARLIVIISRLFKYIRSLLSI